MNNLSWMIYAADVASGVGTLVAVGAGVSLCGAAGAALFGFIEEQPAAVKLAGTALKFAIPAAILAAVIPAPTTIYAIAASEMGEDVLNSETGGKAMQALDAWLDRQIAGNETEQDQ